MPQEDDVARLVAVLEADLKGFTKGMDQAQRIADQRFGAIEKRMKQSEATFSKGFSNIGGAIIGGAAIIGLERFVASVTETATKIKTTATAIGVGTDALQEWGAIASKAGVDQDSFNAALDRFAKNLGDAQTKGGAMATTLKGLGVDIHANTETAFLQFADAIAKTGSQSQKAALVTQLLGRNAAAMVPFIQQGSAAIRAQGDELKRTGAIISSESIDKIAALGSKWDDVKKTLTATGANVLGGFADEFSTFADELKSPEFQQAMRAFGAVMAEAAVAAAKLAPLLPAIVGAFAGAKLGRLFGPEGSSVGALVGAGVGGAASLYQALNGTPQSPGAPTPPTPAGTADRSGLLQRPAGDRASAKAAADAAKAALDVVKAITAANVELARGTLGFYKAEREQIDTNATAELIAIDEERKAKIAALDQERIGQADYTKAVNAYNDEAASKESAIIVTQRSQRAASLRDELEQRRQLADSIDEERRKEIASQHDAILAQVQGTEDYYKVARELSAEDASLEKERITQELNHQLETLAERKQAIEAAGKTYDDYETERTAATTKANFAIAAVDNRAAAERINLTEDETHAIRDQVTVMDQARDGLEGLGEAALSGSKSFVSAVSDMLKQLALLIIKLYVLKPLVESVLGREGTTGGGILGSIIGSASSGFSLQDTLNFASGGVMTSRGKLPLRRYAGGGVARSAQLAMYGEGSRPEAYVPLPDGRSIPVSIRMPSLQPSTQGINVSVQNQYSFAGAVDEQSIRRMIAQGDAQTAAGVVTHIQKQMPGYIVKAQRDNL